MEITAFSIEEIKDPTNIIESERYEFLLDIEVAEEDELYSEAGIEIRAIIAKVNFEIKLLNYFIIDKADNNYLDFALEEDEESIILEFAKEQLLPSEDEVK